MRINRFFGYHVFAAACCCTVLACSDIHRGDWVPTDSNGSADADAASPGDVPGDTRNDLLIADVVGDVPDIHGDVSRDLVSPDLMVPDVEHDVLPDVIVDVDVDDLPDRDADDAVFPDVLTPDADDELTPDIQTPDIQTPDADDDAGDVVHPLACVNNDDECIDLLELAECQRPHCNVELGRCEARDKPDNDPCSDDNLCNGPDKCISGECMPGPSIGCHDGNDCTLDDCEPLAGCLNTKLNAGTCNDGNACTSADNCVNGECVGTGYSCDDDRDCTQDLCDGLGTCQHEAIQGTCYIDDACVPDGDSFVANPCMQCIPGINQYEWTEVEAGTLVPGAPVWYRDFDGDEYGDPDVTVQACGKPDGYISVAGDCDDDDGGVKPGVVDDCDDVDSDCDGATDDDFVSTPTGCGLGECADTGVTGCSDGVETDSCTAGIPTEENCTDGLDNDCDGLTDALDLVQCCPRDCVDRECGPDPACGLSCGDCPGSDACVDAKCVWQAGEYAPNCGPDGMCFVPAGPFWMGCNDTVDSQCSSDESPYHNVTLGAYYIDKTEVTQREYKKCVDAGDCSQPGCNWAPATMPDRPVVCVNWTMAGNYCSWADKRLATEAEWEKAARGTDGRKYPWGNETATCDLAVFSGCPDDAQNVCSKSPAGDSPYGLCDAAGNVGEWISDRYDAEYYAVSPSTNPTGPATGTDRMSRGGTFYTLEAYVRASDRVSSYPAGFYEALGFRCVRSEVQPEECDGIDNDIDGEMDEGFSILDWDRSVRAIGESCGTGACEGGLVSCSLFGPGAECDTLHLASIELDNGIDDDCNGLTDDNYCTPDCSGACGFDPVCGISCGSCTGSDVCVDGECVWQAGEYTPNCGADGMCFVPAGPFWMGCNETVDSQCQADELPYHDVELSSYYIDRTEVTQSAYKACVDAGECATPTCTWDPIGTPDSPVVCVDWTLADRYCTWAGKRLPTEAEWEKAARGTDGRKFPWGNQTATCEYAVMEGCPGEALAVCSKSPDGDSPYGLCDSSGNAWEWVLDWYDSGYYTASPGSNPTGPVSGSRRFFRGGSFVNDYYLRSAVRGADVPQSDFDTLGFRCARSQVSAEVCDGIDNDIDGQTDEDFTLVDWDEVARAVGDSCGTGACADGHVVCSLDGTDAECDTSHLATIELNNGVDDDCNGLTDDNYCTPDCSGRECGADPVCNTSCGTCGGSDVCVDGECLWQAGEYTVNCGPDGMCFVPAGPFWMGCNETVDDRCREDEMPYHQVTVSQYYIDRTSVTLDSYEDCVTAGACTAPATDTYCNWGVSAKGNHPVNCVNWTQADRYCEWAGKRLPTEAEWEKAARGTDGRVFPWGNENATCTLAVMYQAGNGCGTESTGEVCSKSPSGDSPYGLCDMAGNVWEWLFDWYAFDFYAGGPILNPLGPPDGTHGILHGGGFDNYDSGLRSSYRLDVVRTENVNHYGFRCVRSESEPETCDGVDNDIDGLTDEDFSIADWDGAVRLAGESCGTGACANGQVVCSIDGSYAECDYAQLATPEQINGVDDDCDGQTDECPDIACIATECGIGPICGTDCGGCTGSDVCDAGQCVWQAGEYTVNCGADGMCFVPEGPFWMGCNETVDGDCQADEHPYHEVTVSAYYIDRAEVTQREYKKCVDSGLCQLPSGGWDPAGTPDRPVTYVNWGKSRDYCAWAGKRLPTEAEWEKGARGTDGRRYAWGNEVATCEFAVMSDGSFGCGAGGAMDVCSRSPAGDSPYGLCDMSGNVWDWVSDYYDPEYYGSGPILNPTGPTSGVDRIARGGSASNLASGLRTAERNQNGAGGAGDAYSGFRCVRADVQPETCDGVDNDIDGLTDEDFSIADWDGAVRLAGESCGTGACANGQVVCSIDGSYAECDYAQLATIELLNGIDDDCNGLTDDNYCTPDCSGRECGSDPVCNTSCGICGGSDVCVDGECVWQAGEYAPNCGADGMCFVPAGPFWMGCNATVDGECAGDELPYHEISLSSYYVDKTEVTQWAYKTCVDAGGCTVPASGWNPPCENPGQPVVFVDWSQATAYCEWVGKRLPTEAEWEKAARGTDGRKYPWGSETATCDYTIMYSGGDGCGTGDASDVCSRSPAGDAPYGLCDMSGNVWEWVSDWYASDYYTRSPSTNPTGPDNGTHRTLRGGGFYDAGGGFGGLRASDRGWGHPSFDYGRFLGFRCVRSEVQPETCDGVDNDIDGLTDEDFSVVDWDGTVRLAGESCGTGACANGQVVCSIDGSYAECDSAPLATIELLNGIDDDCNGLTDDNYCTPDCSGPCGFDPVCGVSCGSCTGSDVCVEGECVWQAGEYTVNCGADGMCFVPAGPFWMGCNETVDSQCGVDEFPYHEITLSAFYIDRSEVSVDAYAECHSAGACTAPVKYSNSCTWYMAGRGQYPLNCIDWSQASQYCAWKGQRLPTEAEWEKAARGVDGRLFPWGNEDATCGLASMNVGGFGCGTGELMLSCSKSPAGDSPFGLCDMAGSALEWVNDVYDSAYYLSSPDVNPPGPANGSIKGKRGGCYAYSSGDRLTASDRDQGAQSDNGSDLGFRCVRSEPEPEGYFECDGIDNDIDGLTDEDWIPLPTSCGVGICESSGQMLCVNGVYDDTCSLGSPLPRDCFDRLDNDCNEISDCMESACGGGTSCPPELIISEYGEGSSQNKWVEISNIGDTPVDLSGCSLDLYLNGGAGSSTFALASEGTTIVPLDAWVVCHPNIASEVAPNCDATSDKLIINGDDAVVLTCNGIVTDSLGESDLDPGLGWGVPPITTYDHTLCRSVRINDRNHVNAFDPADQWISYPQNYFDGMGISICL